MYAVHNKQTIFQYLYITRSITFNKKHGLYAGVSQMNQQKKNKRKIKHHVTCSQQSGKFSKKKDEVFQ